MMLTPRASQEGGETTAGWAGPTLVGETALRTGSVLAAPKGDWSWARLTGESQCYPTEFINTNFLKMTAMHIKRCSDKSNMLRPMPRLESQHHYLKPWDPGQRAALLKALGSWLQWAEWWPQK